MDSKPLEIRRIRQHTQDLRSRIRDKVAVAELAHELAHQLNNPLEALLNLVYLARQTAQQQEMRNMLDEIEAQLMRMSTLVRSVISLERGDPEQRLKAVSMLLDPAAMRRIKDEYEAALHLASIVESANDAIYSKKLDGTIMAWNAGAEHLFGYSAVEALGKDVRMLIGPDFADEEREMIDNLKMGKAVAQFETLRRTKAGDYVRVSISISPIRNPRGRVVGASTIAREVP
jgi:PAS domain S-box-containing protein